MSSKIGFTARITATITALLLCNCALVSARIGNKALIDQMQSEPKDVYFKDTEVGKFAELNRKHVGKNVLKKWASYENDQTQDVYILGVFSKKAP